MKYFLLIYFLVGVVSLSGQEIGSLAGKIVDAKSGDELPGVNIILKGTYYGAATDINGNFRINSISIGNYTVQISYIGYKTMQFTGIKIEENKTKQLDVKLEESVLTLSQDIVVIGDKTFT